MKRKLLFNRYLGMLAFLMLLLSPQMTKAADYYLKGSFDNWGDGLKMEQIGNSDYYRVKVSGSLLKPDTEIKVNFDNVWYGKSGNILYVNNYVGDLDAGGNIKISGTADTQDYLVTFCSSSKNLYLDEVKENRYYFASGATGWENTTATLSYSETSGNVYTYTADGADIKAGFKIYYNKSTWLGYGDTTVGNTITLNNDVNIKVTNAVNGKDYTVTMNEVNGGSVRLLTVVEGSSTIDPDPTPIDSEYGTSSNGRTYYLVSKGYNSGENSQDNIFAERETAVIDGESVNYSRILRFTDNGDGTYTLNIPTTITGKVRIEEVNGNKVTVYAPENNSNISSSVPAASGEVKSSLTSVDTSEDKWWSFTDRGDNQENDGMYTLKINLGKTTGDPALCTFTHNAESRVAYYFSTATDASAYPVYDAGNNGFSNKFVGYNNFSSDAYYYIITNMCKSKDYYEKAKGFDSTIGWNQDNWNYGYSPTVNKLLLTGNGGLEFEDKKPNNEFSPNAKPMQPVGKISGLVKVEYNPSNGDDSQAQENGHYDVRGQIIILQGSGLSGNDKESMRIIGPLLSNTMDGDVWNWTAEDATEDKTKHNMMTYDETEQCYTITLVTTDGQCGKVFRFVQNSTANNSDAKKTYGEESANEEDLARLPYYDTTKPGHAATVADPNGVQQYSGLSNGTYDIIFNRPAGEWTIKFYLATDADGNLKSYYTINSVDNLDVPINPTEIDGEYHVLRTFSFGADIVPSKETPARIYVAHEFQRNGEDEKLHKITGNVNLYEINYVPANTGVVLVYDGPDKENVKHITFYPANEYNAVNYKDSQTDQTKLWKNEHSGEAFNNDLVPVLESKMIYRSVMDEDGNITARNFALSMYSKTKAGKEDKDKGVTFTDYIGFFRLEGYVNANYAYLQYDNNEIDGDSQLLNDILEGDDATRLSKMAIIFEGINDEDGNETTGITTITDNTENIGDGYYYNLQGIKVNAPVKSGIYIHNGKKVVIK